MSRLYSPEKVAGLDSSLQQYISLVVIIDKLSSPPCLQACPHTIQHHTTPHSTLLSPSWMLIHNVYKICGFHLPTNFPNFRQFWPDLHSTKLHRCFVNFSFQLKIFNISKILNISKTLQVKYPGQPVVGAGTTALFNQFNTNIGLVME